LLWVHLCLLMILVTSCRRGSNAPEIKIEHVWSRPVMVASVNQGETRADSAASPMPHSGSNGVVYMTIVNEGGVADRLLRAQSAVCEVVELHQTILENGSMRMQKVETGLEIPAHGRLELAPRGNHIMLMDLKRSLAVADTFSVQLEFEKSGVKTAVSEVRKP